MQYLTKIICKVDRESLSIKPSFQSKLGADLSNTPAEGNKRESVAASADQARKLRSASLHFKATPTPHPPIPQKNNERANNLQLILF